MEATTFEICCGSAGLSDALRRLGFQVYPIDHAANRHAAKVKVFTLDVSNSDQVRLLEQMLHHCRPCLEHAQEQEKNKCLRNSVVTWAHRRCEMPTTSWASQTLEQLIKLRLTLPTSCIDVPFTCCGFA